MMPYKDPERRKSYLKNYREANHARIAAYDRNRGSWRYFRLKDMAFKSNERLLANIFGQERADGISIVSLEELENPGFIVVSTKGRLTTERLHRAGTQEGSKRA